MLQNGDHLPNEAGPPSYRWWKEVEDEIMKLGAYVDKDPMYLMDQGKAVKLYPTYQRKYNLLSRAQ